MSLLLARLSRRLQKVVDDSEAVLGFAIKDLSTGGEVHVNGDEVFPAASTIKIGILLEFFRRVAEASLNPFDPVTYYTNYKAAGSGVLKTLTEGQVTMPLIDYATLMITVSDNSATNMLIDVLTMDRINRNFDAMGLKTTRLNRKMMDVEALRAGKEVLTTPREMVRLFESLYRADKVAAVACSETLRVLRLPKEGLVQGVIRSSVPSSVEISDKSGWVDGAICNVGVVYQPGRPYVIGVFAKHIPQSDLHWRGAMGCLTEATGIVHRYFEEASTSTSHGRRMM